MVPSFDLVKAAGVYNVTLEEERQVQNLEKVDINSASHVLLNFERAQLPYMPYCTRAFFLFDGQELTAENGKYVGTFTILPIVSPEGGILEKDVHMHAEITSSIRDQINSGGKIQVFFEPVQVRGRDIPDEPLKIENVTFSLV